MAEKRGLDDLTEETQNSKYGVLIATRPAYTVLAREIRDISVDTVLVPSNRVNLSEYERKASEEEQGKVLAEVQQKISDNQYRVVITDRQDIAEMAIAEDSLYICLTSEPIKVKPGSHRLDPGKREFVSEFRRTVKRTLESYELEPGFVSYESEKRLKVLIVEDDAASLRLYQQTFEDEGYDVKTAASVEEATPIIEHGGLDAVITDYKLPEGPSGGLRVLQTAYLANPDTPVIVHTGYKNPVVREVAEKAGAFRVINKSSDSAEKLLSIVSEALSKKQTKEQKAPSLGEALVDYSARLDEAERRRTERKLEELMITD